MSLDFSQVTAITIPEGSVSQITDSSSNVLWSATSSDFTVNFSAIVNIGSTSTTEGNLRTHVNTWNNITNATQYTYTIGNINRQISGQVNIPYDQEIQNAKFLQVNQLAFKNTSTTSRSDCYVQIYDYNLGSTTGMIYDSRIEGDGTFDLPGNTTNTVYLTLSTKPKLEPTKTYVINVYTYSWFTQYRAAKVYFSNYDIAPGDAS